MKCYGVTNDPSGAKEEHGSPADFEIIEFHGRGERPDWEERQARHGLIPDGIGSHGNERYGFTFTMTDFTRPSLAGLTVKAKP